MKDDDGKHPCLFHSSNTEQVAPTPFHAFDLHSAPTCRISYDDSRQMVKAQVE